MIVPSDFPNGDAGAVRDFAFANIYRRLGYRVVLIGAGQGDKEGYYYDVQYYSIFRHAASPLGHLKRFVLRHHYYTTIIKKTIYKNGIPNAIHFNHIPERTINYLIKLNAIYEMPLIHDSTEWYSPCEFDKGVFDKQYILKNRLNKHVIRQPIRVIAISQFLKSHFEAKGCQSKCIPVIMDVLNTNYTLRSESKIVQIVYAGNPSKKDCLKEMVYGASIVNEKYPGSFLFHVVGVEENHFLSLLDSKEIPAFIKIYGRIPRNKVENLLNQMDFSVLLRPSNERYAMAGFPTKSVEAMTHRVAMLCNISSDLGDYLIDGVNSIIVNNCSAEAFAAGLERAILMPRCQIESIKDSSRRLAEQSFDFRKWITALEELL